jgi:CTP-dependent riboflavin kinase
VSVWPQPASELVHYDIQGEGLLSLTLFDALGRVIDHRAFESGATSVGGTISLSGLGEGVYYMQVRSASGLLREKIVHIR